MIQAKELTKQFGVRKAVDNVSFEVKTGEVLGFLGPNGAGKSTTMRMLTGYLAPTSGNVVIDGHDMDDDPIAAKSVIGYLPENAPAYADMTVRGFLEFVAGMRGLSGAQRKEAVDKAVSICELEKVCSQSIDTLSKGYRHRTCFAQAILGDPKVLILDEPTDGLDPNQKHQMRQLIAEMGKTHAIIVSTHILEEVEAICTRVIIIDKGHIVFNGTPAELRAKSPDAGAVVVKCDVSLDALSATCNVRQIADGTYIFAGKSLADVKALFSKNKWEYSEIYTEKGRLDEVFRIITSQE